MTATKKKRKNTHNNDKQKLHKSHWISFFAVAALFLGTILFLSQSQKQQQTTSNAASDCTVSATDMQMKPIEKQFLDQINAYRKTKGAAALTWNNDLKKPAQWLSNDMATKKYLNHTDSLGRAPDVRYTACNVTVNNWEENILEGATSAADALKIWQGDVPHDSNMTNPQMKQIGIGSNNGYWTTDFSADTPTTSATPSASVAPSSAAVPSPNCLGACPSAVPSGASISATPSTVASTSPTVSVPATVSTTNSDSLLQLLLQLIQAFLGFFQQGS
jgi:uncharacterized protein YkwD